MTEYRRERVERDCDMLIVRERLVSCQQLAPNKTYRHANTQTCYNRVSLCQIASRAAASENCPQTHALVDM